MSQSRREKLRTQGHARSPHWHAFKQAFLKKNPACVVCGRRTGLEVHHILPYHLHPERELDETNVVTLCRIKTDCHLTFGHAGDFSGYNPDVLTDAKLWSDKFKSSRALAKAGRGK